MKERFYALDFLRTLMMFLGIVFHGLVFLNPNISWYSKETNGWIFKLVYVVLHSFRMPLFFFLSGFFGCMLLEKAGTRRFLKNRLERIAVPLVLAVCTVVPLTNHFFQAVKNGIENRFLADRLLQVFSFEDFGFHHLKQPQHLWFLHYLCAFLFAITPVHFLLRLFSRSKAYAAFLRWQRKIGFPVLLLLLTIPTAVYFFVTHYEEIPTPYRSFRIEPGSFLPFFYYFFTGWLFYFLRLNARRLVPASKLYLCVAFAGSVIHLLVYPGSTPVLFLLNVVVYPLSVWLYVFGFLGIVHCYFDKPLPYLPYFSEASYWTYLVHPPVIIFLKLLVGEAVSLRLFACLIVVTLLLSLLSYNYLVRSTYLGKILCGKKLPRVSLRRVTKSLNNVWFIKREALQTKELIRYNA